jgi:hypothetical protein
MSFGFAKYFLLSGCMIFHFAIPKTLCQNSDSLHNKNIEVKNRNDLTKKGKRSLLKLSDTVTVKKHSPKKATWMSAALPGLGQIYNRKYWKLPIIYAGFGVIGYLAVNYNTKLNHYKSTYLYRMGYDLSKKDYFPNITNTDLLYSDFTYYRRNFELTCIFGSVFYVLNIIDAAVDAHLYKFDISDDLSMRIEPQLINYDMAANHNPATGIKISLNFR